LSVFACLGGTPGARLGMVVAKRNVRLAVDRNKLKRLIRELFRQQHQQMQGLDVVVVVKRDFALADSELVNLPEIFKMVGDKHSVCCKD
jgi:ribonuclease P protein component